MQGLVVVRIIVEKIWNVNVNSVKVTGAQNIGQCHWVNVPAKSGQQQAHFKSNGQIGAPSGKLLMSLLNEQNPDCYIHSTQYFPFFISLCYQ